MPTSTPIAPENMATYEVATPGKGMAAALLLALEDLARLGPIDEEFPVIGDEGLLPLDDIDLGEDAL